MEVAEIGESIALKKGDKVQEEVWVSEVNGEKMGGAYPKKRVTAAVESGREMYLVIKFDDSLSGNGRQCKDFFGDERLGMTSAQRYYERWKFLRKNSISTVGSMRVVDGERIAMGDMTADGSEFFGKAAWWKYSFELADIKNGTGKTRKLTQIEKRFLAINPGEIKRRIGEMQKKAWDNGVKLPYDDPYDLLVHPDGTWEVLTLDLARLTAREDRGRSKEEEEKDLEADLDSMFDQILNLRRKLEFIGGKNKLGLLWQKLANKEEDELGRLVT